VHEPANGTKQTYRGVYYFVRFQGEAEHDRVALTASAASDPYRSLAATFAVMHNRHRRVVVVGARFQAGPGGRGFYFRDPNGHVLEVLMA
jgi:hypothetical protein